MEFEAPYSLSRGAPSAARPSLQVLLLYKFKINKREK
jgi:hypothetical protein